MRYLHILMLLLLVVLTACGNDEEFVIDCEIRGLGSTSVEMYYSTRGINRATFHPVDGKVVLRGVSAEPTLVEVSTIDNRPLFMCVAANGDKLEVKMDLDNPASLKIEGNEASEEYAKFVTANDSLLNSGDVAAVNRLIADEVRNHPGRVSSAMLLVTRFDARGYELEADSLVNLLKADSRPQWVVGAYPGMVGEQVSTSARGSVKPMTIHTGRINKRDTTVRYWPSSQSYSMIVFTQGSKGDSILKSLRKLYRDLPERRFKALEIAVMGDSAQWAGYIRNDSAKWMQAWVAGGVGNSAVRPLQVPVVPFFIVADSTGKQIYRGNSLRAADDSVRTRLARFLKPESETDSEEGAADADAVSTPATGSAANSAKAAEAATSVKSQPRLKMPQSDRKPAIKSGARQLQRADSKERRMTPSKADPRQ